jgi:hypothetical protein
MPMEGQANWPNDGNDEKWPLPNEVQSHRHKNENYWAHIKLINDLTAASMDGRRFARGLGGHLLLLLLLAVAMTPLSFAV